MIRLVCSFLLFITPLCLSAQFDLKENYVWAFGFGAGLDFNSGVPVPISTNQNGGASGAGVPSIEASASVADASGNLLFYTNGTVVWDRAHNVMPGSAIGLHGLGLTQNQWTRSTTQGALIVPMPEQPGKYLLFSLTDISEHPTDRYPCRMFYSVIDMRLNNGMGDIVSGQKWMLLDSMLSEKMIAIRGECNNVWVMVHARDTNAFKAYEVTRTGLNINPVWSYTGSMGYNPFTTLNGFVFNVYHSVGEMKISPDRKKIVACWGLGGNFSALYDFDPVSGIVSNALQLHAGVSFYGAAFSPDNSKVYVANAQDVWQYNLSMANIVATRTIVGSITGGAATSLKLAPDRKIYIRALSAQNVLGVIAAPDQQGASCLFNANTLNVPGAARGILGFPNEVAVPDFGTNQFSVTTHYDTISCSTNELRLVATGGYASYEWLDGITGHRRTVTTPGTYVVQARYQCDLHVDTFHIVERPLDMDTVIKTHASLLSCRDDNGIRLQGAANYTAYTWDNGSDSSSRYISQPGTYWVSARHFCNVQVDSFLVAEDTDLTLSLGADTTFCSAFSWRLQPESVPEAQYTWQDGSTAGFYDIKAPGIYWLQIKEGRCIASDTIRVRIAQIEQNLGADRIFCREEPLLVTLEARVPASGSVVWSTGSSDPVLTLRDTGMYWVTVTDQTCMGTDTIQLASQVCDCFLGIPDAFTPNGDGRNDEYRVLIEAGCPVLRYNLRIYDRWGALVYSGNQPASGWNGMLNGVPADMGVYMYEVQFEGGARQHAQHKKGDLTLIR